MHRVLNSSGAPAIYWLLCLNYVIFIMNRIHLESIQWRTPYEKVTRNTPDISIIYCFQFYDRNYFKRNELRGGKHFPSESNESLGQFVGFLEDVGYHITYIIIIEATDKILYRSRIKLASLDPNRRIDDNQKPPS